jgi:predicted nucleic acid-binding protein
VIILDTNVVSELMKADPEDRVVDWLDQQASVQLFLSAVTVAELRYGVARLPDGKRKLALGGAVESMIIQDFDRRVLAFDEIAAGHYADMAAKREKAGRPIAMADAQIAATCRSHEAILATRDLSAFENLNVALLNPWTA